MTRRTRSALLRGAARVLDLRGTLSRGPRSSFEADGWAIRSDWVAVGRDMGRVVDAARDGSLRDVAPARRSDSRARTHPDKLAAE
jgi:hypothetical protein